MYNFECTNCIKFCREIRTGSSRAEGCDVAINLKLNELEEKCSVIEGKNKQLLKQLLAKDKIIGRWAWLCPGLWLGLLQQPHDAQHVSAVPGSMDDLEDRYGTFAAPLMTLE